MKKATTVDEQLNILKSRGMLLDLGEDKSKEVLSDIGYFRFGFYCFPFEETYPDKRNRNHQYKENTKISDVVELYYLDVDLRNILYKYINRIEINFRTNIVYLVSNKYINCNTWFVDQIVMKKAFIDKFDKDLYTDKFKKNNSVIKEHHTKYINDKYAPAWKTLEFFTFRSIHIIYKNLKDISLKKDIAAQYGIRNINILDNYFDSIIATRNICAHGGVLFDHKLSTALSNGPALTINNSNKNRLYSVINVILFILQQISENRADEMRIEIEDVFNKHKENRIIRSIIENCIDYKEFQ